LQLNTIVCLPLKSSHPIESTTSVTVKGKPAHCRAGGKGMLLGMLYLDSRRPLKVLPQHRQVMLQVLADQMALTIENALLQREMQEKKLLNKQLRAAKVVQQRLFPAPAFSHPRFAMAYHYAPAQQIGGDYLAFLPLSDSRFLFAIGDVVGKGLPAGLVVMTLQGGLHAEISHHPDLPALVRNLDRLIYENAQGKVFVTFFACVWDADTTELQYICAGHNHPLLCQRAGEQWCALSTAGIPLGVDPAAARKAESITLQSGDLLALYTDGITETRDIFKKQFGAEGLKKVLSSWLVAPNREKPPLAELVHAVFARVQNFTDYRPLADDATLMLVAMK
jgi:sigma-B regulation protein RsbU (phosphoserine phosphatase)